MSGFSCIIAEISIWLQAVRLHIHV